MDKRSPLIYPDDYMRASGILGCEVACIRAVSIVESLGSGFFPNGHPKILFEGHIFHRYTNGKFDAGYPTISYSRWTREHYRKDYIQEIARYELAKSLNEKAAIFSASWGKFQIMGFNYSLCGFLLLKDFVAAMFESEQAHLDAFCKFLIHERLDETLRNKDWVTFARRYNGPLYWKNKYDEKLARAYDESR